MFSTRIVLRAVFSSVPLDSVVRSTPVQATETLPHDSDNDNESESEQSPPLTRKTTFLERGMLDMCAWAACAVGADSHDARVLETVHAALAHARVSPPIALDLLELHRDTLGAELASVSNPHLVFVRTGEFYAWSRARQDKHDNDNVKDADGADVAKNDDDGVGQWCLLKLTFDKPAGAQPSPEPAAPMTWSSSTASAASATSTTTTTAPATLATASSSASLEASVFPPSPALEARVRLAVAYATSRVNRVLLLRDLYDRREASALLISPDNAPFACPALHSIHIRLPDCVTPSTSFYDWLAKSALAQFAVRNARDTFVYRDEQLRVWYFRVASRGSRDLRFEVHGVDRVEESAVQRIAGVLGERLRELAVESLGRMLRSDPAAVRVSAHDFEGLTADGAAAGHTLELPRFADGDPVAHLRLEQDAGVVALEVEGRPPGNVFFSLLRDRDAGAVMFLVVDVMDGAQPVSYTHLTLPTN